ncbi:NUDIX domain-containing protein [Hyphobacterium sp.]|uniref:NUDIX domain-containing protein n=1 Tax=Hyphobacterium sp. TaxID=2004662 RepID=UPI003BA9BD7E
MTNWRTRLEPLWRPLIQMHWRRTRGMTLGVRGLVVREDGFIRLVRHTYTPGWYLPGGGVERGETLEQALEKELREEAGIRPTAPPELFKVYSNEANFRGDHVALFVVRAFEEIPAEPGQEIAEMGWFPADKPAPGITRASLARIAEVLFDHPVSEAW